MFSQNKRKTKMMLYENDNTNDRKGNAFTIKILTIFFFHSGGKISREKKNNTQTEQI